jgi:hypothetical protein
MNLKPIAAATLLALTATLAACGDQTKAPSVSANNPSPNSLVGGKTESPKPMGQSGKPSPSPSTAPVDAGENPTNPEPSPAVPVEPSPTAPDVAPPPKTDSRTEVPIRPADPLPATGGVKLGNIEYRSSETAPDAGIEQAIVDSMGGDRAALASTRYYYDRIDLSGDGKPEALVFLNGSYSCGSGGCTMLVLEPSGQSYQMVSRMTLVHAPVIVSSEKSAGWNDLVIQVAGGGAEAHYARMQFDGSAYPGNPSTAPDVAPNTTINGTAVIGDDMTAGGGIALRGG